MDVDSVIKKTYSQIFESKLRHGFIHGLNDCFALGALYHYNLFGDATILDITKMTYNSEHQLQNNVQRLGYKDIPDVFVRRGYTVQTIPDRGDISLAMLPLSTNKTLLISTGGNSWITSTGEFKNDKLTIIPSRLSLIGRPPLC
jgi:hypothetical protein